MLRAVGHAVVVNPDPQLARVAASEEWEVLRLDRLGWRLKVLAALVGAGALSSLGQVARERVAARRDALPLQSRSAGPPRTGPIRRGAGRERQKV
jgi:hypothetical protein